LARIHRDPGLSSLNTFCYETETIYSRAIAVWFCNGRRSE
jgi:hypothetical protein